MTIFRGTDLPARGAIVPPARSERVVFRLWHAMRWILPLALLLALAVTAAELLTLICLALLS